MQTCMRRPAQLTAAQREGCWQLMCRFVERERAEFDAALDGCDRVVLLLDGDAVEGLMALKLLSVQHGGRPARVTYVQWLQLSRRVRKSFMPALALAFICLPPMLLRLRHRHYLLWASATWQSYLRFANGFASGWPLLEGADPDARALLAAAMPVISGACWDGEAGLLRGHGVWRYKVGLVDDSSPDNPHVRLFAQLNPDQATGDCLVCATRIRLSDSWRYFFRRAPKSARRLSRRLPRFLRLHPQRS